MKRDFDLIRKILLAIEEHTEDTAIQNLTIDGYNHEQITYQMYLIHDAGLVEGEISFGNGTVTPCEYYILRMTWAGRDFLNACRDEGRWVESKEIFGKQGGVTFDVAKEILVSLMTTAAKQIITGGAF